MEDIRQKIRILLKEKGVKMSNASIAIGQNQAYLQQFIRYGRPQKLSESARKGLALYLGISEDELLDERQKAEKKLLAAYPQSISNNSPVSLAIINATACCGNGIENETENVIGFWQIPRDEYRAITTAAPEHVKMLRVFGDSMEGTLADGDWVLVDISRNYIDGDGLFLIRMSSGLAGKRIQNTIGGKIVIKSDNKKYDNIESSAEEIPVIGKVIYTLKAEKVG